MREQLCYLLAEGILDINRILVLGSEGREHAPGWKLANSPKFGQVFVASGNHGKVLAATAIGARIAEARDKAYEFVDKI